MLVQKTTPQSSFQTFAGGTLALLMLASGAACGDGSGKAAPDETDGAAGSAPVYVVASRITLPSGGSTVIAVLDSLEANTVDTRKALEVSGSAAAHGTPEMPNHIFVAHAEAPEITRYEVKQDGGLVEQDTLSLMSFGLSRAPRSVVMVSATKAYAVSVETHQIFEWNPTEMVVEQTLELPQLERDGFVPGWVFRAALRGDDLLVPITWFRNDGEPGTALDSALVVVHTKNNQVTIHEEPRCGGLRAIFQAPGSEAYFSASAGAPATYEFLYGEQGGSAPCLVRMHPDDTQFDAEFMARPSELVDGKLAVDFSPAGPSHLIFQVFDEALFPVTDTTLPEEMWDAAAWRFYSIPISILDGETPDATALDLPPSSLNALRFEVDGRNFVPRIEADYSHTTLVDVSDPDATKEGPNIVGSVGNFFRLR